MNNEEYKKLAEEKTPNSPLFADCVRAFVSGGFVCVLGQIAKNLYLHAGISDDNSAALTAATLVALGVIVTALHLYDDFAEFAGAGALLPITGFANAICAPAIEFGSEGRTLGTGAKMFTVAGPVLMYGLCASAIYGVILYVRGLF